MIDHAHVEFPPEALYDRPTRELLAAVRARRVVPGPEDPAHARALRGAARRTGRTVVEADGGRVLLGWDADTEGVWAGEGMEAVRSARPAQPRLLKALAACLRCCWADPDAPIYPAGSASVDDVMASVLALGGADEANESGLAAKRKHARGALTTLEAAGLIELDEHRGSVSLGPVIATWSERDVSVLRALWPRLPAPPADRRAAGAGAVGEERPVKTPSSRAPALADLHHTVRADVLAAVRAVEEAEQPVPRAAFRALADATLRATVERVLGDSGRVLMEAPRGFLTGYADDVREALAADGIGVLPVEDRAVLCLVMLHAVAIPRARGIVPREAAWTVAEAVDPRTLSDSKLPDVVIRAAVRRLRDAGILAYGKNRWIVPGPQFARLTPAVIEWVFEELVMLAEPEGLLAEAVRRRRTARRNVLPAGDDTPPSPGPSPAEGAAR